MPPTQGRRDMIPGQPGEGIANFQVLPARHCFSVGVIALFLQMVIGAATSMRSASAVLKLVGSYLPYVERTPCANSGRLWLLRVGLLELSCEKEKADDWVWMMDHTIQLGPWKCLIVIGIRLSCWLSNRRPLSHDLVGSDANGTVYGREGSRTVARVGMGGAVCAENVLVLNSAPRGHAPTEANLTNVEITSRMIAGDDVLDGCVRLNDVGWHQDQTAVHPARTNQIFDLATYIIR